MSDEVEETSSQGVIGRVAREGFWALPRPRRADGAERRTGIEIEFAGLSVGDAAEVIAGLWGGTVEAASEHAMTVADTRLGDVKVELDSVLKAQAGTAAADLMLDWARAVVPVEIVTAPLAPGDLPETDRLVVALAAAGAEGTRDGWFFGFGVHLNPEVAAEDAGFIVPVVRAYALVEDWLRAADPLDPSRRLLPFVDPWPRNFVDAAAAAGADWTLGDLTRVYLELTPTRNRGLDLLPLLEHLDPEAVRAVLPEAKGGRPTWHYRLPGARIGEADWSIAYEWNRWVLVERVAARAGLLEAMAEAWAEHRGALTTLRGDWAKRVEAMLADARVWEA